MWFCDQWVRVSFIRNDDFPINGLARSDTMSSPMVTLMTVLLNVLISSRVKTFQEAQNIGGIIILPVVGMMAGQASGLFLVGSQIMLLISFAILILNVILLQRITKYNDRFVLFEKQIH